MTHKQFEAMQFRGDDGTLDNGSNLIGRAVKRGQFVGLPEAKEYFAELKIGDVFKTGVSAWERVK